MSERSFGQSSQEMNYLSFGIIFGAGLGLIAGVVIGNHIIGLSVGIGVGIILSDAICRRRR